MKTKLVVLWLGIFAMLCYMESVAQVTIGSDKEPEEFSVLEVISSDENTGGLRLPQLTSAQRTDLESQFTTEPQKTNSEGLLIYNVSTNQIEYWDGTKWIALKLSTEPWMVSGKTNTEATSNAENIYQMGQVTIGSNAAVDATAALNVVATNKGVLLPKVTLKAADDDETIPNPTAGLLVYNTGDEDTFTTTGYMFWDGSQWRLFANASAESARAVLTCAGASMSPGQQILGGTDIMPGTILQIPYTGSNGGSFNGVTLSSVGNPNVTATIVGSMLAVGNGILNFSLSGTPLVSQQAPNGITFDLTEFLDENPGITGCDEVVVGSVLTASVETTAVMGFLMETTDENGAEGYGLQCNSPDGKFSVRVWVPKIATYNTIKARNGNVPNVQLRNNGESEVKIIWNDITFYNTGLGEPYGGNGIMIVPAQEWGGNNQSTGPDVAWVNSSPTSNSGYFGQKGIYDGTGSGPEYRRYTWIPIGNNEKTAYEIHVMAAIDNPASNIEGTPTQLKAYIKFEQVTAQ